MPSAPDVIAPVGDGPLVVDANCWTYFCLKVDATLNVAFILPSFPVWMWRGVKGEADQHDSLIFSETPLD